MSSHQCYLEPQADVSAKLKLARCARGGKPQGRNVNCLWYICGEETAFGFSPDSLWE